MAKPTLADFVDFFTRATKGGAKELDLGDIKSPSLRRGRPSKTPPVSTPINPNEIDLGDIDPLAIKKGRPAKSPIIDPNEIDLGKSKGKLEIGDAPSSPVSVNELDMGDISPINPNIDDYRIPVKSDGIDAVGGGKVPSVIGQAADEMPGPLSTRSTTIPTEVGPEVLGKGTSRVSKEVGDIPDATIVEKIKKMADGPLKMAAIKKYAPWLLTGGTTAAIIGNKLSDDQSPSATFTAAKINGAPSEENQPVTTSKQNAVPSSAMSSSAGAEESQASKLSKILDEEMAKLPKDEKPAPSDRLAYMEMMQNAQQSANQNEFNAALLKAAMQAGAAIAGPGVKMDTSIADALAKSAQTPVSNVKGLMETDVSSKKLIQLEKEMEDESKMRDPNSQISKTMAEAAVRAGFIKPGTNASAYTLQKMGLNLTSILNAQEAAKTRKHALDLAQLEDKRKSKEKEEEKELARQDKRKLITEEVEGFRSTIKSNLLRAKELLDKAGTFELFGSEAEELNAIMDEIATDTAKLQDPKSVARPTEVKLVRQNLVPGTMMGQLGMTNETAQKILDQFEKRVDERANTAYSVRGIKLPESEKSANLTTPSKGEVERTIKSGPDKGRIAIFDAETQQFLRFK